MSKSTHYVIKAHKIKLNDKESLNKSENIFIFHFVFLNGNDIDDYSEMYMLM